MSEKSLIPMKSKDCTTPPRKKPLRADGLPPATKHGIQGVSLKGRFNDIRTQEGKMLRKVMKMVRDDLGPNITAAQELILANIRSCFIIIFMLSEWIEKQSALVGNQGNAYKILDTFRNERRSLEKSLAELKSHGLKVKDLIPDLDDVLEAEKIDA